MTETKAQSDVSIATEASDWYARLRAQDVSDIDAARFRAWLAGDPARRREFEAIDAFWSDLVAIEKSSEVVGAQEVISARRRRASKGWYYRPSWAIAATLVVSIGGGFLIWQQWNADRYVTGIGEQRTVPLADGSVITLNTATEVKIHYSEAKRGMELVRGQANFQVAKDARRPFVVTAGERQVRAIGTSFDVYKSADRVTVTLIEGKVAVTPTKAMPSVAAPAAVSKTAEITLGPGEQLSYSAGSPEKRATVDVMRITAWRTRKLDFSDTPILEAIAEANRYSRDQIVLDAPGLLNARISGTFEAGRNDVFVDGLESFFDLTAHRTGPYEVTLTVLPN